MSARSLGLKDKIGEVSLEGGEHEDIDSPSNRNPGLRLDSTNRKAGIRNAFGRVFTNCARFRPVAVVRANTVRLSRKFDEWTVRQMKEFENQRTRRGGKSAFELCTLYKRKADKVRPVDSDQSDGCAPGGDESWKTNVLKEEALKTANRPKGKYDHWLTPKFSDIATGSRLTPERAEKMLVGDELTSAEKDILLELLYNREAALAWDFEHIGHVREEVAPPQKIRTVPHSAWQAASFPVPKALVKTVVEMLRERLKQGLLERCNGPYRNPWFLVKKKNGMFRLVNAAMSINAVTVRDANLPPVADEFAEEFAGMTVTSLIDFFSGYDQVGLATECRDLTGFMTPLGLLRQTTLPQGGTNSVAQFVRVVVKILEDHIPSRCLPFLDDIGVKGPRTTYDNEEVMPGVRRYILEHLINLDRVLADLERAGCTISGEKSQFCKSGIKIVGFVCDAEGRHPQSSKIEKIVNWPSCRNTTEVKGFLGICVYYRIWVEWFAQKSGPLYRLLRSDVDWRWGEEEEEAMCVLKEALTTAPALVSIDYSNENGVVILAVDASMRGWGAVLMWTLKGQKGRHPVRYESGLWSVTEQGYDALKRECRGLLKALKKFRWWLYGIHFVLETDANTLVAQLNRSAADLPGALVTRWLAWIRLFDFEVRHVPGTRNTAADALSRRPATPADVRELEEEVDIEDFIDAELKTIRMRPVRMEDGVMDRDPEKEAKRDGISSTLFASANQQSQPGVAIDSHVDLDTEGDDIAETLEDGYSEESQRIARYLVRKEKPADMSTKEFNKFKKKTAGFLVRDGHLFKKPGKLAPIMRVVDEEADRARILAELHDKSGHRGREGTYRKIAERYWWDALWRDVKDYVRRCAACQFRASLRTEEALFPTWSSARWEKVGVDIVHMPVDRGFRYLVLARSDFSGWVEGRPLRHATSENVARFLWEEIICRHGRISRMVMDGGPENKDVVEKLAERYGIRRIVASAYHPQGNGMVERGHSPITASLSKLTGGGRTSWIQHLHAVLWADRITVRASTGLAPYEIEHSERAILPIEAEIATWHVLPWNQVRSTAELLAMRARQLEMREEDMEEARLHLRRAREMNKEYFDQVHNLRHEHLEVGDLVLLHDTKNEKDMSRNMKLAYRWVGPYRIKEIIAGKGTFVLEELDGAQLGGTVAGNRLKKFFLREEPAELQQTDEESEFLLASRLNEDFEKEEDEGFEKEEGEEILSDSLPGFYLEIPRLDPRVRAEYTDLLPLIEDGI